MTTKIALPELLNSKAALKLKQDLDAEFDRDVELDLSAVRHVGAQALQVLISAQTTWKAMGKSFVFTKISTDALTRIEGLGGREHLDIKG